MYMYELRHKSETGKTIAAKLKYSAYCRSKSTNFYLHIVT